jgi:acetylglutamate kinase
VLDKSKNLLEKLVSSSLSGLYSDGTISGGMIPKLGNNHYLDDMLHFFRLCPALPDNHLSNVITETAAQAVEAGVGAVSIMDGRVDHCILRALSGEVFGTRIVK